MVALNTAYAAPKNAADPKNRVGNFFYEDHASVGKNRWASRLNAQGKSCYHYETASGRSNWSNRDPIQEQGGLNLYAMVQNNPIDYWDYLGMSTCGKSWWDDAKMYAEAFGEGLLDGVQILADTVDPFDDPFANAGAYDPNNPYNQTSQNIANIATSINPAGLGKAALKTGVKAALSGGAKSAGKTATRTEPKNLREKLSMDEAKSGSGKKIMEGKINDKNYKDTHDKMSHVHEHPGGAQTEVHYWKNKTNSETTGYKFK